MGVQRQTGARQRGTARLRCRQLPRPHAVRHLMLHRPDQLPGLRSVHARIRHGALQRSRRPASTCLLLFELHRLRLVVHSVQGRLPPPPVGHTLRSVSLAFKVQIYKHALPLLEFVIILEEFG